jgi:adenosyl cobinamide kinase/adenosyl cobinamide phosphate guanylyltransferase
MGAGYVRQASGNMITDNTITAADHNAEYNSVQDAFNGATGHVHDGTTGNAPNVLNWKSTNTGATAAPILDFHRDSSSPADADILTSFTFSGEDDGSNVTIYSSFQTEIVDVTGGTEDGKWVLKTMQAGTLTTALDISSTVTITPATTITGALTTTAGITTGSSIISDTDSTDSLGSTGVRWLKGWFDTLTAGTLTIGSGSVVDSSGAISFGDENLTTTGIVTAAGTSVFTNLDISGDVDVDGTTNLDIVDIDGAVNMATTALVTGVLTTTATQVATGGITSGGDIVSDTDSTDSLGSTGVRWLKGWFDDITMGGAFAGATGTFSSTLAVTGLTTIASLKGTGAVTITDILDEDNMASDSATKLSTQQSIKAYVDAQVATADTLSEVLAIGNTTGGTDVSVTTTDKVQFRDAAIYINSSVDGQLDIVADTEIQIAATTVDLNGALDVSGTALVTGVLTTTATQVATGGITSGSDIISDTDSTDSLGSDLVRWLKGWYDTLTAGTLTIGSGSVTDSSGAISFGDENLTTTGTVTAAGTSVFTNLDISGDIDVDGTSNLDVVDIDGAVDMATTLTVAGLTTIASLKGTGAVTVTDILDEDNMISDSATKLATQQSIKAYVDAQVDTVDTLAEVLAIGNTTGGTDVSVSTTDKVQFRDAAIYINSSVDGQLDIVADTEIQIAATTIDINGAVNASGEIIAASLDISGDIDVDGTANLDIVDIDGAVNMATTALVTGVLTTTATQVATGGITSGGDIISDTDSTDSIGSTGVRWLKGWFDDVAVTNGVVAANLDGILGANTPAAISGTTVTTSGIVSRRCNNDTMLSRRCNR